MTLSNPANVRDISRGTRSGMLLYPIRKKLGTKHLSNSRKKWTRSLKKSELAISQMMNLRAGTSRTVLERNS